MKIPEIQSQPTLASTRSWREFALLDSGGGKKLERYGTWRVVRPEPQCMWSPRLPESEWAKADAIFDPGKGDDESGRWRFTGKALDEWETGWESVRFIGRFTPFRHLAYFPEQAANWSWLQDRVRSVGRPLRILNLFGYTGVASLVCAAAGAEVTHVDASKKAVAWARQNAATSNLEDRPVRWIVEDARKYAARETRRGNQYDGIILDPPKFGRGPGGEVWRLHDDLPGLMEDLASLLSPEASFLLLNAYAERISGLALAGLTAEKLAGRGGQIEWGELALMEEDSPRGVGLSFFARWTS